MRTAVLLVLAADCGGSDGAGPSQNEPRDVALAVDPDTTRVVVGESEQLVGMVKRSDGSSRSATIRWSVRDPAVATVSTQGLVSGVHAGETIVVASAGAFSDSVWVLPQPLASLSVSPRLATFAAKDDSQLVAVNLSNRDASYSPAVSFFSRDTNVARVSQEGRIVSRGDGTTWILAIENAGRRDSLSASVTRAAATIVLTPDTTSIRVGLSTIVRAAVLDRNGNALVADPSWTTDQPSIATVDASGSVHGVAPGVVRIRGSYGGKTGETSVTVRQIPALSISLDTIIVGVSQLTIDSAAARLDATEVDSRVDDGVVTVEVLDSSIASPSPANLGAAYRAIGRAAIQLIGLKIGETSVVVRSPGFRPDTAVVLVGTPRLRLSKLFRSDWGGPILVDQGNDVSIVAALADPRGRWAVASVPTVLNFVAADTNIGPYARFPDVTVAVSGNAGVAVVTSRNLGNWWFRVTAPGYAPDSTLIQAIPKGMFFLNSMPTSQRLRTYRFPVATHANLALNTVSPTAASVSVTLRHSNPLVASGSTSLQLPEPSGYAFVPVVGLSPGTDTLIASAPGFNSDTLVMQVTPITLYSTLPPTMYRGDDFQSTVIIRDQFGRIEPSQLVKAVVKSTNPLAVAVQRDTLSFDPSRPGSDVTLFLKAVGPGSASISIVPTHPYSTPLALGTVVVDSTRTRWTTTTLGRPITLGMRQHLPFPERPRLVLTNAYRTWTRVESRNNAIAHASVDSLSGDGEFVVDVTAGSQEGDAWFVAFGPGTRSDSVLIQVRRPQLGFAFSAEGGSLRATVKSLDWLGNERLTTEAVHVDLTNGDSSLFSIDSTSLTIPADASHSTSFAMVQLPAGQYSAILRALDRRTEVFAYTGAAALVNSAGGVTVGRIVAGGATGVKAPPGRGARASPNALPISPPTAKKR